MTTIETAVIVIAAAEVGRCLMDIFASIKTVKKLNWAQKEFERLRDGLNLGAQVGAAIGGGLGAWLEHLIKSPGPVAPPAPGAPKASSTSPLEKFAALFKGKNARPNSGPNKNGQNNAGPGAGA